MERERMQEGCLLTVVAPQAVLRVCVCLEPELDL